VGVRVNARKKRSAEATVMVMVRGRKKVPVTPVREMRGKTTMG
jgi:hypothetical protein